MHGIMDVANNFRVNVFRKRRDPCTGKIILDRLKPMHENRIGILMQRGACKGFRENSYLHSYSFLHYWGEMSSSDSAFRCDLSRLIAFLNSEHTSMDFRESYWLVCCCRLRNSNQCAQCRSSIFDGCADLRHSMQNSRCKGLNLSLEGVAIFA